MNNARDRLIESTQDLLWERGYVGTSPKAIQLRAEAGQGSMYHHFTGKADLALAAIERNAELVLERVREDLGVPGTAIERITRFMTRERDIMRGCRVGRLTQDPDIFASPDLRRPLDEAFSQIETQVASILAEGRENGEFDTSLDPKTTAAMLLAVVQGGYVLARAHNDPQPFADAIQGALTLLRSYRAAAK